MIVDFTLLVIVTLLGVGLTVVGGFVASDKCWVRACFLIGGPILVFCIIVQGIRQIRAQIASDSAFMNSLIERGKDRQRSDVKIDGLFVLLQTKLKENPPVTDGKLPKSARKPQSVIPSAPAPTVLLPPNNGKLVISQTSKTSTRSDAAYESEVIIQTTDTFPSLKLAIQCNQTIVDASGFIGGAAGNVQFLVNSGVLKEHPNVFSYSYGSSTPPFSPSNPLIIDVWSNGPINCNQVATF